MFGSESSRLNGPRILHLAATQDNRNVPCALELAEDFLIDLSDERLDSHRDHRHGAATSVARTACPTGANPD